MHFKNTTRKEPARILKVSEDGDIAGKKFRITSDNGYEKTFTTDASGSFTTEPLPVYNTSDELIHYLVEEVETPVKFVQPGGQSFTLDNGDVTLKFSNILKKFRVEVTKSDSETGNRAQGNASLSGAKYGIYKGGELIDVFTTDSKGYFVTPYYICGDDWELKAISPSEGYLIDQASYHVGAEPGLYRNNFFANRRDISFCQPRNNADRFLYAQYSRYKRQELGYNNRDLSREQHLAEHRAYRRTGDGDQR